MLTENPVYDAAFFIKKFEAIPEDRWITKVMVLPNMGERCALGHAQKLGILPLRAFESIDIKFNAAPSVIDVNDGREYRYSQFTPKQRVLAWLRDAKEAGL